MDIASSSPLPLSAKHQLVLTAERLYALHGLDGVPLRHIGAAAGTVNKSAVAYHFGSKAGLIDTILRNRLDDLIRRRNLLNARVRNDDLRGLIEAHYLPLIELAEDENCYYPRFLEQLVNHSDGADFFARLPAAHFESLQIYYNRVEKLIQDVPQALRDDRIFEASTICLHLSADRHRARTLGESVAPYALHVSRLLDSLVAIISAPPSVWTLAALKDSPEERTTTRTVL